MKKRNVFLAVAAALCLLLSSCGKELAARAPDPLMVTAYTAGTIPRASPIRVVLSGDRDVEAGSALAVSPFRFTPPVSGSASWEDSGTIVFTPSAPLKAGTRYRSVFDFAALDGKAGSGTYFTFEFQTAKPSFDVAFEGLKASRSGDLTLSGVLETSDVELPQLVEKTLSAKLGSQAIVAEWKHESPTRHFFTFSGIKRPQSSAQLNVSWNGRPLASSLRGSRAFRVPDAASFEVLSVRAGAGSDTCVEVSFSAALDRSQDLRGLIGIDGISDLRYETDGGLVRVYASMSWPDTAKVRVEKGIKDSDGRSLAVPVAANVDVAWKLPELRFASGGVIIPSMGSVVNTLVSGKGPSLPVETMNLQGMVIEVFRVYGDNMLQFLQVNGLDGQKEMDRVGELVLRKTMDLGWKDSWKNSWTAHELDLTDVVKKYPDGMFQIRLTFGRQHIRYVCVNDHDFSSMRFPEPIVQDSSGENDDSYWDWSEDSGFDYDQAYNLRNDPCHPAFYDRRWHDVSKRRNVLVSDIGVIARLDADSQWHFAVSNLRTAAPIKGARVSLYNYQRRELVSGLTDANGFAIVKASGVPFAAAVSADMGDAGPVLAKQRSWLRVDASQALAVSHFDIGGESVETGIKGHIYGERGVWRPGDDIHLVFIKFDREKRLPEDHPVLFELENPQGQVVQTASYTSSVGGFYKIDARTNMDAPTGNYVARVRVGDKVFTKTVKIEMVMPNRLKLALDFGAAGTAGAAGSPEAIRNGLSSIGLKAAWLHGAPASNLKADVSVVFGAESTAFTSFSGYSFDDATRSVSSERSVLFDEFLDGSGQARIDDLELEGLDQAPGKLKAYFLSRVFEPSGVFSSEQFAVDYYPYKRYVGLKPPKGDKRGMLLTDQDHVVELAMVDSYGKPVASGQVDIALYQIEWRWWWEKGEENLAEYSGDIFQHLVQKGNVRIKDGKAIWNFKVAYPSWGRYMLRAVDKSGGHAATSIVYIDWPGWAGRSQGDAGGSAFMLSLSSDKTVYRVGETVTVSFPSNAQSRALIAVERSGRLVSEEWINCKADATTYSFKAGADMSPNVYVHVSFVQPHRMSAPDSAGNDAPIRLYGVLPVSVENPETALEPVLKAPDVILPNSNVSFSVSEAKGRAMNYTVAVVDEGLLGITRFKTINPRDVFYKKEASLLSTFDLYQMVSNAFSGKLETLLAIGGGDYGDAGGSKKTSRFPPVVRFFGPFALKAGATGTQTFALGPYVGAVRFMVVAGTLGGAFGMAEKETQVKAPLMAFVTAPRVLSLEEKAVIPVTLFSTMGPGAAVSVEISVSGPLEITGDKKKTVVFPQDGEGSASFDLKVGSAPGEGTIVIKAASGKETVEQRINLSVRSLATPVTVFKAESVEGGATKEIKLALPGITGSNSLTLELSRYKPINLGERLAYLIGYPHGCAEQTTSRAFPQLLLPDIVELDEKQAAEARSNVLAAIDKLGNYQSSSGGMSFWPGSSEDNQWLSSYVFHFLSLSKKRGFEVPSGMYSRLLKFQKTMATMWNSSKAVDKSVQAYRLYGLSIAGAPDIASMNRLRESTPLPTQTAYQLAAAYAKAGMKDAGIALIADRKARAEFFDHIYNWEVYGSEFRDLAVILDALNALGDVARGLPLYTELATKLSDQSWYSTQETAFALIAVIPYIKATSVSGPAFAGVSAKGKPGARIAVERGIARVVLDPGTDLIGSVIVRSEGGVPLFARLVASGTPKLGQETKTQSGVDMRVAFKDINGGEDGPEIDPDTIPIGQDLVIEVTVWNDSVRQGIKDLALTLRVPSGWEIANYRVADAPGSESTEESESGGDEWSRNRRSFRQFDYQDIRDDRVYTYFSLSGLDDSRTFKFYVNKTYQGIFYFPAVKVEAMYDAAKQALWPGRWLGEVKLPVKPDTGPKPFQQWRKP